MPRHQVTKYVNGSYEVKTGVHVPVPSNLVQPSFTLSAVCESAAPERWHGQVTVAGQVLLTTGGCASYEETCGALEQQWRARVVEVFSARS